MAALLAERTGANLEALVRLAAHARTGEPPAMQTPGHLLRVAAGWDALSRALGGPASAAARAPGRPV
jgi:hypothetical protein